MLSILSVVTLYPELLGVARFLNGVGFAFQAGCLTLFLQETSPTPIRGLVSSFQETFLIPSSLLGSATLTCGISSARFSSLSVLSDFITILTKVPTVVDSSREGACSAPSLVLVRLCRFP